MGLTTNYEKLWQFDMNRAKSDAVTVADCSTYFLWYWKAFLTGQIGGATKGLWSVYYSCSSLVAGTAGDGVDRWGNTYDNTTTPTLVKFGGGAHSWVVLRKAMDNPNMKGSYLYMLLDWSVSANNLAPPVVSTVAPTGGSTTAAPTWSNPANASWAQANNSMIGPTSNSGPIHVHGQLASDGSFNLFWSRDNTGKFGGLFMAHRLANARPNDLCPWFFHFYGDGALNYGWGYIYNFFSSNTASTMRYPDLSGPNSGGQNAFASYGVAIPGGSSRSYIPTASDVFGGGFYDWPVFVSSDLANIRGCRGRLQDIMYFAGGANTGTVDTTPGAPQYMVVGPTDATVMGWWFPTDQAPIL
jgi:hypothetical protein